MPGRSTYPAYDRALNGRLEEIIRDHRDRGLSWAKIAAILTEHHNVPVDGDTVRRWHASFIENGASDGR